MSAPALRFKDEAGREFSDWKEKPLGAVVENYGGTALEEFVSEEGTHSFISIGNYEKDGSYFDNGQRVVLNSKTKQKLLNKGDLVMVLNDKTKSGDLIGSTLLITENNKFIYNQRSERLVCKSDVLDSTYTWHFLNSSKFRKDVFSVSQGGTQIYVNFPAVKKLIIPLPALKEQTKIANFLTAVDEKLAQLTRKHDLLTQYKKGVMQQIFSQELRFKDDDGREFAEWEELQLGDVTISISNGLNIDQTSENEGYKVTRIETISDRAINLNKVGYIKTDKDISEYKLQVGDMLFSNINSISHIGKVVFVDADYDLYHGMNLLRLQLDHNIHNPKFVFFQLSTEKLKRSFETKANKAVNQASINQTELKKTLLGVPCKAEQTKIANFLTAIDDKITATQTQLAAVKQYKQGLLQQMFV